MSDELSTESAPPHDCDCSLGWRYRKGQGPDPAQCPVHGDRDYPPVSGGDA